MGMDFSRKPPGFNTVTGKAKYEGMAAKLLERAESVARYLLPMGRREINEWKVGSIEGEKGHSFSVNLKTGIWKEFADGGEGGGDLLALWALKRGVKMHVALDEAAEWLGVAKPKTAPAWVARADVAAKLSTSEPASPPEPVEKDREDKWWLNVEPIKYDYFDGDGVLWATVRRWDKGDGTKRVRPWDHKTGDEKWPEGARPLYKLFDLTRWPGNVILVEGEKCAHALIATGWCATTCAGGSSAVKVSDWSPLRGRDVVRWADNDKAGSKWLEDTHAELIKAGVKSIRDVAVPAGKPEGWDCADATQGEVDELIVNAKAPAVAPIVSGPLCIADLQAKKIFVGDPPPQRWLVKDTIPMAASSVLAAQGGAGKSMLLLDLAMKVATPKRPGFDTNPLMAFGHEVVERGEVVLFMAEDATAPIHRRIRAFDPDGKMLAACAENLYVVALPDHGGPPSLISGDDKSVGQTAEFEEIKRQLGELKNLKMVVFDPLTPFLGGDTNSATVMQKFATAMAQLAAERDCAVIVTHHMSKGERSKPVSTAEEARHAIRGSGAATDGMRLSMAFWPEMNVGFTYKLLAGLGHEDPAARNVVYRGGVVKDNCGADWSIVTYVRNEIGLLVPITDKELVEAKNKPLPASDEAMVFLKVLVDWYINRGKPAYFGTQAAPFKYFTDKTKARGEFVAPTERQWAKLAKDSGVAVPTFSEVARAAVIIATQGTHELCPLVWTETGFDYPGKDE